jgi:nucleotide-binding universal stress UspA family protein
MGLNTDGDEDLPWVLLVAIDFDNMADCTLRETLTLARRQPNCRVHAAHVVDTGLLKGVASPMETLRERLRRVPEQLRSRAKHQGLSRKCGVDLQVQVAVGHPAEELLRMADALKPDVLVVGASASSGRGIGSVAQRLMREAPCPTLLVRPRRYAEKAADRRGEEFFGGTKFSNGGMHASSPPR